MQNDRLPKIAMKEKPDDDLRKDGWKAGHLPRGITAPIENQQDLILMKEEEEEEGEGEGEMLPSICGGCLLDPQPEDAPCLGDSEDPVMGSLPLESQNGDVVIIIEHERDSPKVNVFCALSERKLYGHFFFIEATVTGHSYLDMLEQWLVPQLRQDLHDDFIFQQDGSPPHFHNAVRAYLNTEMSDRWIGRIMIKRWKFPYNYDNQQCII
ncbi:hypothetical protein ANN_21048 [Periplaneta americana]|uniref:Transposase n=1 Tax=Periplaneta americana TaxID=6978 RepID=A0ABQ8SEA5_PERAM|nr:hypothetical protein ANN_21048 [Periplaneta americana]